MSEVECQLEELNFRMNKLVGDSKLLYKVNESDGDFNSLRGSDGEVEYLYRSPLYFPDFHPKDLAEREWLERGQNSDSRRQSGDCSLLSSSAYPGSILGGSQCDSVLDTNENRGCTFNVKVGKITLFLLDHKAPANNIYFLMTLSLELPLKELGETCTF